MERKGRIWGILLIVCAFTAGCTPEKAAEREEVTIKAYGEDILTRAIDPDENLLNDVTVMVFDEDGNLEYSRWFGRNQITGNMAEVKVSLIRNKRYSFYVCGNFGYHVKALKTDDMKTLKWHMAYPDEYREGMVMCGKVENIMIDSSTPKIHVPMYRIMAKISLKVDRSRLNDNVRIYVTSVRICNCPKSSYVFSTGRVSSHDECFSIGFARNEAECSILNRNMDGGTSGAISLYMLENMQGTVSNDSASFNPDEILDKNDIRRETASYIELEMDYISDTFHSETEPLRYRIYIGDSPNSLDVERNCHYHITVIPEKDGLSGGGWRVDKKGIIETGTKGFFDMTPSGYIQADIGDTVHVRCRVSPADTEFDIGMGELEFDKSRGIYDYVIDPDGKGVSLVLKSQGTGILYMSAGNPINETGMLVIEVNRPDMTDNDKNNKL